MIEITQVPGRTDVLLHKGNTMHDLAGCIAIAAKLGCVDGIWDGVNNSREAFQILMDHYGTQDFMLEIVRYESNNMIASKPASARRRAPVRRVTHKKR